MPTNIQPCYLGKESRNTSSFGLAFMCYKQSPVLSLQHVQIFSYCCPVLSLFSLLTQSPPFLFSLICCLAETHSLIEHWSLVSLRLVKKIWHFLHLVLPRSRNITYCFILIFEWGFEWCTLYICCKCMCSYELMVASFLFWDRWDYSSKTVAFMEMGKHLKRSFTLVHKS